jgi:hypothetical protein
MKTVEIVIKNKIRPGLNLRVWPLLFGLLFIFLFFRGSFQIAWGGPADNVRGYAWNSNTGWISMNCANAGTCAAVDYGVKIWESTGKAFDFDGYAWSSGLGWISFKETGAPDYGFNANCHNSCDAGNNCTACYDPDDGKIYGWAKILSLGNDGWIKFDATAFSSGVYIDQTTASAEFKGWAWNGNTDGSTGVGWISFNCSNTATCGTASYFAYLSSWHLPEARNLSAPNWNFAAACAGAARNAVLRWQFYDQDIGSSQTAYELILNTSNTTTTPVLDTGKIISSANQVTVNSTYLNYDTAYYWWVRVWDNFGLASRWTQFNTAVSGHTLTDNIARNGAVGNAKTFTPYQHEMPDVSFSWVPLDPLAYYPVTSTDASYYYTNSARSGPPVACSESACGWYWGGYGVLTNSTPTLPETTMTFDYGPNHYIDLNVTDPEGYRCGASSSLFFIDLLPTWKEKKAE